MRQTAPTRRTTHSLLRLAAGGILVVTFAIVGTLVATAASPTSPSPARAPSSGVRTIEPRSAPSAPLSGEGRPGAPRHPGIAGDAAVTRDDGALPAGVTVFDGGYPGIGNLDPGLLRALRDAATEAARDGVDMVVNSGWRSSAYQDALLREAVAEYGSEAEAARWVATADTSPHVSGNAVDIGSGAATAWLSAHGAAYGLCQIYRNEPWHYELRPRAVDDGCPRMYPDPTRDPRMSR